MKNKLLTFLVMVLLSVWQSSLMAQTATSPAIGDGSSDNPYQIATLNNLYWIAASNSRWSYYYIQTADIDASSTSTWFSGAGCPTIGDDMKDFDGTYDGLEHTITGLYINLPARDYVGLFGSITGATIKNLGLINASVSGNIYVGALVGYSYNIDSQISNCFSTGTVSGTNNVGGLIGYTDNTAAFSVSNCYSSCSATCTNLSAGGLIGCINNGSTVTNCYSTGAVSGPNGIGGLIGYNPNGSGSATATNCFWDTQTSGQASSGSGGDGGTGKNTAEMQTTSTYSGWDFTSTWSRVDTKNNKYPYLSWQVLPSIATITTTAATSITANTATLGGNVTADGGATVDGRGIVYALTDINPNPQIGGTGVTNVSCGTGTGVFNQSINTLTSNTSYSFNTYAHNSAGTSYGTTSSFFTTPVFTTPSGAGTPGDPYLISNLSELFWMAHEISIQTLDNGTYFTGQYFKQTADIDASATSTWFGGEGWMPIGYLDEGSGTYKDFGGIYDGQGHVVSNIYINRSAESCVGLFGTVTDGVVKNLGVTNLSINARSQTGGLVGYLYGATTLENCYTTGSVTTVESTVGGLVGMNDGNNIIRRCYSECNVTGQTYVAGLFGQGISDGAEVSNCYATGSITSTGDNALTAGLIAYAYGTITNCYATSSVSNSNGGCAGLIHTNYGHVSNCYASGAVTGKNICGGFIGVNGDGKVIDNCYSTGSVTASDLSGSNFGGFVGSNLGTISDSYTISQLIGSTSNMGGFVGRNASSTAVVNSDCFWNSDVYTTGCGSNIGTFSALGKTTTEMQTASTFTSAGWNTPTSYWSLIEGRYPQLLWATSTYSGTGNWSASGNWSNGLPGTTTDAIISGTCTVDDNYTVANVTINSGSAVTVLSGKTLTVSGSVVVNSDATSNGSLLVEGTVSGNVTYNRYVTANNWHLLSSPVAGQAINDFSSGHSIATQDTKYGIALYDNTVPGWSHYTTANIATSGNFISGKGYEMMRTAAGTLPFTGTINTSPVTIALTSLASPGKKWNLIGNPFTAAINANSGNNFITVNTSVLDAGVYQAIYIWDPSASGGTGDYITVNQSSAATYIAPGQAFFVYSKDGGGNVSFTTAMQTNQTGNIFKSGEVGPASITLYAAKGTVEKSTHIKYIENMTTGIDPGYDAGYFDGGDNSFAVYTQLVGDNTNTEKLDIQCLPTNGYGSIIPVGLNAVAGSEVTFSIETSNLPVGTPVYLEDKQTGAVTALEESGSYYRIVLQESSEGYGRFYLYTKELQTGIETSKLSSIKVLTQPKYHQLLITGVTSDNSSVELYDLFGRKLLGQAMQQSANNEVLMSGIRTGIYLVRIQDGGRIISQKISWLVD